MRKKIKVDSMGFYLSTALRRRTHACMHWNPFPKGRDSARRLESAAHSKSALWRKDSVSGLPFRLLSYMHYESQA